MNTFMVAVSAFLVVVAVIVVVGLLISFPLMLLWNACLVPAIPAIKEVDWLQMWGITILIGFLFKANVTSK